MTMRPVYVTLEKFPYFERVDVNFKFYQGHAYEQKILSIRSLHSAFKNLYPDKSVLEISTKSEDLLGSKLSAFNLPVKIPNSDKFALLESAYQGSKVFENGEPFTDLFERPARYAKSDGRLRTSGKLIAFQFDGEKFPLEPKNFFYNWLYITALAAQKIFAEKVLNYDAFTDIAFNPQKSISTQAMAAAIFVGISRAGLLDAALKSKDDFLKIIYQGEC